MVDFPIPNQYQADQGSNDAFITRISITAPKVTTTDVSNITSTTALSGGNVKNNGGRVITKRGVCWSTSPYPTTADNKTDDGAGLGSFTSNIIGLMEHTTYYVRAYAVNSAGTGYGKQLKFTTHAEALTVTITEPQDGAQVSGTVFIKATVTAIMSRAADASIQAVQKVEFYVDDVKIAEDSGEPYETTWNSTSVADGYHTIKAVAYNIANHVYQDQITVQVGNTPPEIMLNRTHLNYGSTPRSVTASVSLNSVNLTTGSQTILINNTGGGTLNWTANKDAEWLTCTPEAGTGKGAVTVTADPSGLQTGTYNATISIQDPNAANSPQTVPVVLKVYSSGATTIPFGYFYLDTTAYLNGVHTIAWSAQDNAGNRDGIGSRYFTIVNTGDANISGMKSNDNYLRQPRYFSVSHVNRAALSADPVFVKKGYDSKAGTQLLYPDHEGVITVQSREDQRIEIVLGSSLWSDDSVFSGYLITGNRLQLLPAGSTPDNRRGIFYWHPCAGFLGLYRFVFVEKAANGQVTRKLVKVVILPE